MGIWLLIFSYWTANQKPILVQILSYKNRIVKRIIREDEKSDQEETQDCYPFHYRLEAYRTTFKLYKNSKSQTLETLVSF